jgi:hypothetical protein
MSPTAVDTTTPFLTVAREWDKLEPAMNPEGARTKQVKLKPNVTYALGQIVGRVTATSGLYGKPGAGVQGPYFPLQYPCVTDASGFAVLGPTLLANVPKFQSMPVFWKGPFFVRDLVGIVDDAMLALVGKLVQGAAFDDTTAIVDLG